MRYVLMLFIVAVSIFQAVPLMLPTAHASVVSGEFIYQRVGSNSPFSYRVEMALYQGVKAWRISWLGQGIDANHLIRQSDLRPLYTLRINHENGQRVEIRYSSNKEKATVYHYSDQVKTIERLIWDSSLYDLGSLPQILAAGNRENFSFSAINYSDGKVYQLVANKGRSRTVDLGYEDIRCVEYTVKLDSWLSALISPVHLLIPQVSSEEGNLVSYKGPGLDGGDHYWSLQLIGRSQQIALLKDQFSTTE